MMPGDCDQYGRIYLGPDVGGTQTMWAVAGVVQVTRVQFDRARKFGWKMNDERADSDDGLVRIER